MPTAAEAGADAGQADATGTRTAGPGDEAPAELDLHGAQLQEALDAANLKVSGTVAEKNAALIDAGYNPTKKAAIEQRQKDMAEVDRHAKMGTAHIRGQVEGVGGESFDYGQPRATS